MNHHHYHNSSTTAHGPTFTELNSAELSLPAFPMATTTLEGDNEEMMRTTHDDYDNNNNNNNNSRMMNSPIPQYRHTLQPKRSSIITTIVPLSTTLITSRNGYFRFRITIIGCAKNTYGVINKNPRRARGKFEYNR
jgi:hypothetical protein